MKNQPPLSLASPPRSHLRGVTLIELLISLTIGLLIIAGIGYAYLGTKQNFRSQDALARMQEGARTTFEIMDKDIRMAGFNGCSGEYSTGYTEFAVLNPVADWYKNIFRVGELPLKGYESSTIDNLIPEANYSDGLSYQLSGDGLTILHANTEQNYIVSVSPPNGHDEIAKTFTLLSTPNPKLQVGAIVIVSEPDCSNQAIFANTDTDDSDAIIAHANNLSSDNLPKKFANYSRLFPLTAATYFIKVNDFGEPALYRKSLNSSGGTEAEELIEGVQDMQILYGEDTSADAVIDEVNVYRTADNVANWSRVLAVRINLLMVSRQDEGITTEPQSYAIDKNGDGDTADDGETVYPDDRLLRKVFTTTIAVKNRLKNRL